MTPLNPEIGRSIDAAGIKTNFLEEGSGPPVILLHGSGPGVTAYANWRLTIPALARNYRVLALDIAGFGYTERKADAPYGLEFWLRHVTGFMDALGIPSARFIGNSFGGALALALAARHPSRVVQLVLMGSVGTEFELTPGLDAVWGYQPSVENMRALMHSFAYDASLVTDDLIRSRYEASIRPGFQEAYARLFPAPRAPHIRALATAEEALRQVPHRTLIIHGRDDRIIPLASSLRLHSLIVHSDLHVFGECGHWTQIEKKDAFVQLVGGFFST